MTGTVDLAQLDERIGAVQQIMHSHGGSIELVDVAENGDVEVRFVGMCQGCPFRPLTMHSTILPALAAVPGVREVRANGARISVESAERLATAIGDNHVRLPPVAPRPH